MIILIQHHKHIFPNDVKVFSGYRKHTVCNTDNTQNMPTGFPATAGLGKVVGEPSHTCIFRRTGLPAPAPAAPRLFKGQLYCIPFYGRSQACQLSGHHQRPGKKRGERPGDGHEGAVSGRALGVTVRAGKSNSNKSLQVLKKRKEKKERRRKGFGGQGPPESASARLPAPPRRPRGRAVRGKPGQL